MPELTIRCHILKLQLHRIKTIQSSEFWESGQCIIEPLDHVFLNSNLIGCTEKGKAIQYFIKYICMPK